MRHILIGTAIALVFAAPAAAEPSIFGEKDEGAYIGIEGGMWFPDKPYPGHDVDESNPVADLELGTHVLIEALVDLSTGPALEKPLER